MTSIFKPISKDKNNENVSINCCLPSISGPTREPNNGKNIIASTDEKMDPIDLKDVSLKKSETLWSLSAIRN